MSRSDEPCRFGESPTQRDYRVANEEREKAISQLISLFAAEKKEEKSKPEPKPLSVRMYKPPRARTSTRK
jgi:hypothetical protein